LLSLILGGFGDAAAEEVAVLPGPSEFFFDMAVEPTVTMLVSDFLEATPGCTGGFGDDSTIAEGASLFTVGEGGTEL